MASYIVDPSVLKKPRTGEHSEKPGRYSPIVRIHKQVIDPSESLTGDVFFTGYGEISLAKLQVTPSFGIFDKNRCYWWAGMKKEEQSDGSALITFGDKPHSGGAEHGITIHLTSGGIITDKWDRRTIFFDHAMSEGSIPQISTECALGRAPVEFKLGTYKSTRPGTYTIRFVLTYFDGDNWQVESQEETFKIRNILDRWQLLFTIIGTIAALSAIMLFIAEIIRWFA